MTQQVGAVRPAEGLFAAPRRMETVADLFANVWQFGYVTTDLDRAIEYMSERFGLEHCVKLPTGGATFLVGDEPAEWEARFAMGSRGGMIIELIEPVSGEVDFYTRLLPDDGSFAVRFHHPAGRQKSCVQGLGSGAQLPMSVPVVIDFDQALKAVVEAQGSDLHLKVGLPAIARINGALVPLSVNGSAPLERSDTHDVLRRLLDERGRWPSSRPSTRSSSPTRSAASRASASTPSSSATASRSPRA